MYQLAAPPRHTLAWSSEYKVPSAPFSIFWSRYPINLASSSTCFSSNLVRELPNKFYNTIWVLVFLILHLSLKG